RNSFAGIVRAHHAAKTIGIRLVVGCRLDLRDGTSLLAFPEDRAAYGRLTRLLTLGKRRAPKGECHLDYADLVAHGEGQILIVLPPAEGDVTEFAAHLSFARQVAADFRGRAYLAAHHLYRGDDASRLARLADIAAMTGLPLVATNDVHYHEPERRPLQDVVTCIREHCTIAEAGFRLAAHAERHLKPASEMARLFRGYEDALSRTLEIVARCRFGLDELRYEYPEEPVPPGFTPQQWLTELAWKGAAEKFPADRTAGVSPAKAAGPSTNAQEAAVPEEGIPEHTRERREEVIQYIYDKYGRDRAGIAATVICYRARGAIREVGKALGLSEDVVAALAGIVWGWSNEGIADARVREAGLDPRDRNLRLALDLASELIGFPRHLSQHVGGFVITRGPLSELVPIENAAMADRTFIEWDKDDLDALHILKIDVLALGMLTCIRKSFALIEQHYGCSYTLDTIPAEHP